LPIKEKWSISFFWIACCATIRRCEHSTHCLHGVGPTMYGHISTVGDLR
jgi:hypothetical protein